MKLRHIIAATALLAAATSAHAVYTINFVETGGNVTATGNGTLNTTGMTSSILTISCSSGNGYLDPVVLCVGASSVGLRLDNALSPTLASFTSEVSGMPANLGSGQPVFISNRDLYLPSGYTSGSLLSNSSTFSGHTFTSLGLTRGTRTFTLTSGDTIVINIGPVTAPTAPMAIPTLSEYGAIGLAALLGMLGLFAARRRKS